MKQAFNGYGIGMGNTPCTLRVKRGETEQEIRVPPLSRIRVSHEPCPSCDTVRWTAAPLRNRTRPDAAWTVPGAVQAGSLRLYRVDAGGTRHVLKPTEDYELDVDFAGVTLPQRGEGARETLCMDYELRQQRVDVLAEKDGSLRMFHGTEALVCPRWPQLPDGWLGLARIHLRFTDRLDESAIFAINDPAHARLVNYRIPSDHAARLPDSEDPAAAPRTHNPTWPEVIDYAPYVTGSPEALARLRHRFAGADAFRLVYFGDSITQGGDVDPDCRFTTRFSQYLTENAPGETPAFVNAAIGGTNSSVGRDRFERDVLAHRPDAVTIMFALNDKGLDDEIFLANHRYFVSELKKRDVEPILLTSNMNTGIWMPGLDHAEQRILDFCREEDLICLDAYGIWKDLGRYGIPYETLLSNGINHPDNVAAGVFYELLKRAFPDT